MTPTIDPYLGTEIKGGLIGAVTLTFLGPEALT
jgi:hypothetical protein